MIARENYSEKKNLISIKGQTITKQDYRGLLALALVGAFVYAVIFAKSCEAIASLGTLTGTAVTYYFNSKSNSCCRHKQSA